MPIAWNVATSKKTYFAWKIDQRQAVESGLYAYAEPGGAEAAWVAERANDTPQLVAEATERARLGVALSSDERDILGEAWVDVETNPLPTQ